MQVPGRQQVVIGSDHSDHVTIELVEVSKDGWLTSHVTVCCGGWSGSLSWSFLSGELYQFAEQVNELYRNLAGVAELRPIEPNLTLHVSGDGRGHIIVRGTADAHLGSGTHLTFQLHLDQTELPKILASLRDADR